jgi:hypothetical protein
MNIEIIKSGDNGPYIDCIMVKDNYYGTLHDLLELFYAQNDLTQKGKDRFDLTVLNEIIPKGIHTPLICEDGIENLASNEKYPELFKEFLRELGFKTLKTISVRFPD